MITFEKASKSKYPAQFSGHLTAELDQNLASLDGNTYKVWSCLNRLLDSRAVNCIGQYLGYTVRVTQANIAERINLSIATVKRCLNRLEGANIIEVERPTFGCNRYRLTSYQDTIEAQANPAIPSMETIAQYEREDSITGELPIAHSCELPIAQGSEPHNRPVLTDKSIVDSLSPVIPVPEEEKTAEQVETNRERDWADLFYEEVLERPLRDQQKRRRINRECKRLITDIAADPRVQSPEAAREILIDAFERVKGYAPYSFGIMSADYGERSIEWAISSYDARKRATLTDTPSDSSDLSDTSNPETNAPQPSRAEVDAALLEAWSDDRWQAWADQHVADLIKVRQRLVAMKVGLEPYTESEIESMRAKFTMPQTDEERLDWLRHRVDDHAQRKEAHKPLDRQPSKPIPESPDERLARLKARGVQVDDSQSHLVRCTLREIFAA
ncbi:winged helix-turn-helix domain-containing protein [Candidatus Poribacteria bacterium]|nr:winged helix-turn-helix domain-containing protein [Candidatus Poribacteria bacterium]